MIREAFEPGMAVSMVERERCVNPDQPSHWCRSLQDGSLSAVKAGEEVVQVSELTDALKEIRERLVGRPEAA